MHASEEEEPDVGAAALRFRKGAALVARLGSEQLKDEVTAVIELVKNAYDADATLVRVEFRGDGQSALIRVEDNGTGMSLEDLHEKWAWLATENKLREERSPVHRRRRLGQKGVGRFAAEKLGRDLVLRTRALGGNRVLQVRFEWDRLVGDRELNEYEFPVQHKKPSALAFPSGTRLEVHRLRADWNRQRVESLSAQLAHLIDPEATASDFKIVLVTPWEELNGELRNPLPGRETHRLEFEVDQNGREVIRTCVGGIEDRKTLDSVAPAFGPLRGRKENLQRNEPTPSTGRELLDDMIAGLPAYVSGIQLRPTIDWGMGENDDEGEVRPGRRELAINGRHAAFRAASLLDGAPTAEGTPLESLEGVGALTIHIVGAASSAWGIWHCRRAGSKFEVYFSKAAELKAACLGSLRRLAAAS